MANDISRRRGKNASGSEIAYILKGYPRNSEVFITNEIYLLEQMGVDLRIFSIWKSQNEKNHSIVSKIKSEITYLPEEDSARDSPFFIWMRVNLPRFIGSHLRLFSLRPRSYVSGLFKAASLSLRYRSSFFPRFKKVFIKDFLRAGYIALQIVESGRIQHIHSHFCHGSTTMALFASQLSGVPFSFTAHAKDIYLPKLNPGDLLKIKIRKAEFVATCTGYNREYLQGLCPESTTIHTIYHGLNTALFVPEEQTRDSSTEPLLLSIGRFVEKKGFIYMIQACQKLKEQGISFRYQIVGQADEQTDRIKQLIKELNLQDTVSLTGAVTHEELREIYKECTIFTLPCQVVKNGDRDGIPNVLVEAMAMEIPVVSTRVSGIPELIDHRVNGMLVPERDASALAKVIEELLRDRLLLKQLGKAGREKVCRLFDSEKTTVALKLLLLACLEKNKGS